MPKFKLFYGLGGGFGGANEHGTYEYANEDEAMDDAYVGACEIYEGYAGMHGLRSIDDIMEEDGIEDEDEAQEVYLEERDSWLDFYVEEVKE